MTKKNISKNASEHLRKEISGLLSLILKCDSECKVCDEYWERLYNILDELWDCTDVMTADDIYNVNEFLDAEEELLKGSTYGMVARKLKPVVKKALMKS